MVDICYEIVLVVATIWVWCTLAHLSVRPTVLRKNNQKFTLMLTRREKAYSSSGSVV